MAKKKNLRLIPETIQRKLSQIPQDEVVVAAVIKLKQGDIASGKYRLIGFNMANGQLSYPERFLPDSLAGRYSKWNIHGKIIRRDDLPMYEDTFYLEAPIFGDHSKGTHTVAINRMVYRKDFLLPKQIEIKVEKLGEEAIGGGVEFVFKFEVDETLSKSNAEFSDDLLYVLNLLQENVGVVDIYSANTPRSEFLKTIYVDWEILPPGEREANLTKIITGMRNTNPERIRQIAERYDFLSKLNPRAFINGTSGFRRYFGAKFENNLVAFENADYGNAIYVMFDDWEKLSQMSRMELLKSDGKGFRRIAHTKGWKTNLEGVIESARRIIE